MSRLRVDFCGIVANTGARDTNGIRWSFDLTNDVAVQNVEVGNATGQAGGVLLADDQGERRPVLDGMAQALTAEGGDLAYQIVMGALPAPRTQRDLVVYEAVPKVQTCQRAREPRILERLPMLVRFQIDLLSLSPSRRAVTAASPVTINPGASAELVNAGTAPCPLKITAGGTGELVARQDATGQVLRSKGSIPSGAVIDSATKRVTTSGGAALLGALDNPSEWLWIAAGNPITGPTTTSITNQGDVPFTITRYNRYA